VEAIKKANNLTTTKLAVGQTIRIPKSPTSQNELSMVSSKAATAMASAKEEVKKAAPAYDIQYYTVKSGDNPWKIAKQFNVKFEDLLRLNNLDEEKARNLKIGDKIRVR